MMRWVLGAIALLLVGYALDAGCWSTPCTPCWGCC